MKPAIKKILPILLFFFLFFTGCEKKTNLPITVSGFYFDTFISISIYDNCDAEVANGCISLCNEYEKMLSRTIEGSDIYRINHSEGLPVEVNPETADLIEEALSYAALTEGKIDPTIASVTSLWDFSGQSESSLPNEAEIASALAHVNYQNVLVSGNTVTLLDSEASLDLGFIAKGYIADKLKDYLSEQGIENALINLGGNILTMGTKPGGEYYRLGIEKPFSSDTPIASLEISHGTLVTCGVYERYFYLGNQLYHHIIDTQTGYPVENNLYSVTILASDSSTADALSTTCFVLGLEEGLALIEATDNVEAMFVTSNYTIVTSSGFPMEE